jgi:predicted dehydrogenase
MSRIRIGVIGTGFGARVHVPGLQETGEFEVIGIVSHAEQRGREVAERFAIAHAFTDHRDLLALPGLDAVTVTSTPDHHPEHVVDALAAGKHVLCEKPLARDLADARRIADAARTAAVHGCVAMIDHEFRWQPERRRVKELLDEGYVGTPYSVTAVGHMGLFADPERPTFSWWQQRARGAGWLLNSGSHLVDTLRWWFGEVERVAGFTTVNVKQRRRGRDGGFATVDADDAFGALLRFASGVDAVLHQSAVAVSGRSNLLEICGSEGVLLLDGSFRLLGARKGTAEPEPLAIPDRLLVGAPHSAAPTSPRAGASGADATAALRAMELPPFVCLARELAAAIRERRTREPSIVDAARTQEVCEAIERSAHEGAWLTLPL